MADKPTTTASSNATKLEQLLVADAPLPPRHGFFCETTVLPPSPSFQLMLDAVHIDDGDCAILSPPAVETQPGDIHTTATEIAGSQHTAPGRPRYKSAKRRKQEQLASSRQRTKKKAERVFVHNRLQELERDFHVLGLTPLPTCQTCREMSEEPLEVGQCASCRDPP